MTANPFAALLDGVKRLKFQVSPLHWPEKFMRETEVLAALAAMTKERDKAMEWAKEQHACADDYAKRLAASEAKVAKMVEALNTIDALDPEGRIGDCSVNAISGLVLRMGEIARAAITEASK